MTPVNMQCHDIFIIASESDYTLVRLPTIDSRQPSLAKAGFDPGPPPAPAVRTPAHFTLPTFDSPSPAKVTLPASSGLREFAIDKSQSRLSDPGFNDISNTSRHDSPFRGEAILKSTDIKQMTAGNYGSKHQCYRSASSEKHPKISELNNRSIIVPKQALRKQFSAKWKEDSTYVRSVCSLGRPRTSSKPFTVHDSPASTRKKNNALQRPPAMATRVNGSHKHPTVSRSNDWTQWVELGVQFSGFPDDATTKDVWNVFKKEGEILTIELFDDHRGNPSGKGRVRFRPPPANAFWQGMKYLTKMEGRKEQFEISVKLLLPKRDFLHPSLVNPRRRYPEVISLTAESIDFGFMCEPETMMGMYRTTTSSSNPVTFCLNLLHREIEVSFDIVFQDPTVKAKDGSESNRTSGKYVRTQKYIFVIPLAQAGQLHQIMTDGRYVLLLSLDTPPNFYRKYNESDTHQPGATFWNRRNSLFRQTDILYDPRKLKAAPLTLKKLKPIIDIGRWTTYHFVFNMHDIDPNLYSTTCNALRDFNIEILPLPHFKLITDREPPIWDYIDRKASSNNSNRHTALDDLMAEDVPSLTFPVRYQLEVCISEGWLNEHNLTPKFVDKLIQMEATRAQDLLEYIANQKRRIFNPMGIFDIKIVNGSASRVKIPHYCTYVRSATVTPSMIYFSTPSVETSNRIIRQYAEHADRFLRVRFTDEKFQGKLNATEGEGMNEVYTRVKRALNNGITIGDRHYEYLASGNSQFREHGAYFFCPLTHLGVADIRRWMGDFQDIKVIAKYAARLGQCFSTTRAINGSRVDIKEIEDIRSGKYVFTDGVGKISRFLAQMAASEVGVTMRTGEPPSVFQFRLGGAKGVLAVSPDAKMREIHLRETQHKFPAIHTGLEIIRWSQFSAAHLNRQLILVLSALKVPDDVFVHMLQNQLSNLAQAMVDERMALTLLQKEIDPNQMTLVLARMVSDGFQRVREPFVQSLLLLWRAWSIKYLKEKAKIVVPKGAVLLGCIDETGVLQGHFESLQNLKTHPLEEERVRSLPEVFVQLSKGDDDKSEVMLGPMILARNPSLHPGDIRVVCGVDAPALHHLKDVVVLPQTGDRDLANMCSGGDLDGDDYLVIWDRNLLPREWNHKPMDYDPPNPVKIEREVTTNDITTFFVNYMKNDTLPRIAHAHLAYADYMENGVFDAKCLKLAALHSKAVDYPKTGVPAEIPAILRPRKWPHFMEKKHKPKDQIYISKKILGQLYDQVERVDFVPEFETAFDQRVLGAYEINNELLDSAETLKIAYDAAMHRIMAQHEIRTEFEVWSTFVLQHANQSKDFKFHEEMGAISTCLKDRFRTACYEKAGGRDLDKIGPFVIAMYQVTNNQVIHALEKCRQARLAGNQQAGKLSLTKNMPLISFPWLFAGILGKIANGELSVREDGKDYPTMPIQVRPRKITPMERGLCSTVDKEEDVLKTSEGLVHRGELLKLFDHEEDSGSKGESIIADYSKPDSNYAPQPALSQDSDSVSRLAYQAKPRGVDLANLSLSIDTKRSEHTTVLVELLLGSAENRVALKPEPIDDVKRCRDLVESFGSETLINLDFDVDNDNPTSALIRSHSEARLSISSLNDLLGLETTHDDDRERLQYSVSASPDACASTPAWDEEPVLGFDDEEAHEYMKDKDKDMEKSTSHAAITADLPVFSLTTESNTEISGEAAQKADMTKFSSDDGGVATEQEVLIDFDNEPSVFSRLALLTKD